MSEREVRSDRFAQIAAKAIADGAVSNGTSLSWDCAGRATLACENPFVFELLGLPPGVEPSSSYRLMRRRMEGRIHTGRISIRCRCRKCGPCGRAKSQGWASRAAIECAAASRVWFVTLTFSPDFLHLMKAPLRNAAAEADHVGLKPGPLRDRAANFDCWQDADRFRALCVPVGREVTLYLKRIRRESGAKLRYLSVIEQHGTGEPHVHLLVIESPYGGRVGERVLRGQWFGGRTAQGKFIQRRGIAQAKLVENHASAPWYVCKYITKAGHRVRASQYFGKLRS